METFCGTGELKPRNFRFKISNKKDSSYFQYIYLEKCGNKKIGYGRAQTHYSVSRTVGADAEHRC
jgi:hypothetical protein